MKLDVIYASRVEVGDLVVGEVHRDAPTRPVQPMANGMTVESVTEDRDPELHQLRFHWDSGLSSAWHKSSDLILVIR